MAKDNYTEAGCRSYLEKHGVKFTGTTMSVPRGRIGIKGLGMVDYLSKVHRMAVKYE